jgi:hypothetical protein
MFSIDFNKKDRAKRNHKYSILIIHYSIWFRLGRGVVQGLAAEKNQRKVL